MDIGYDAYWLAPDGDILAVDQTHIKTVIDNPERFGFKYEYIREAYQRHDEPMPIEGYARREIIAALLRKGWIRIRSQSTGNWQVQIARWDRHAFQMIASWSHQMIKAGLSKFDELDIQTHKFTTTIALVDFVNNSFEELDKRMI
jgi:hypothetical protein